MRLLLGTHTFIWWDIAPTQLSPHVLALCQDPKNQLLLSVVSVWEMQIKLQLGKLRLDRPLADMIVDQRRTNGIEILPMILPHALAIESLPLHHKDPFDRLLIAQAIVENLALASRDPAFAAYPIVVVW